MLARADTVPSCGNSHSTKGTTRGARYVTATVTGAPTPPSRATVTSVRSGGRPPPRRAACRTRSWSVVTAASRAPSPWAAEVHLSPGMPQLVAQGWRQGIRRPVEGQAWGQARGHGDGQEVHQLWHGAAHPETDSRGLSSEEEVREPVRRHTEEHGHRGAGRPWGQCHAK